MTQTIQQHEGKKYLRRIFGAAPKVDTPDDDVLDNSVLIDVYAVIEAYEVKCPARQHALKKLLCAGQRSKGDTLADLIGVQAAVNRAIELEKLRRQVDGHGIDQHVSVVTATADVLKAMSAVDEPPRWITFPVYDERDSRKVVGYRVRWSETDERGRFLMVGHYFAGEPGSQGPSLGWCEVAADSHAKRLNAQRRMPSEFAANAFDADAKEASPPST